MKNEYFKVKEEINDQESHSNSHANDINHNLYYNTQMLDNNNNCTDIGSENNQFIIKDELDSKLSIHSDNCN